MEQNALNYSSPHFWVNGCQPGSQTKGFLSAIADLLGQNGFKHEKLEVCHHSHFF